MSDTPTPTEGWGRPGRGNTTKWHYFVDTRSLCAKWGFYGGPLDTDDVASPDNCPKCWALFTKRKAAIAEATSPASGAATQSGAR